MIYTTSSHKIVFMEYIIGVVATIRNYDLIS